ncbi:MAG: helix-turn-helix domain-containing protein [Oscillospiraceae bacterium]|nr:helix-turn-helix domain-containing protein [Oscillospiraceae bacterium]
MVKNLKALRNKKGVSQQKLAESIGISQQSINKYENHNIEPDINTLMNLASYFSTSIDYLVGHTNIDRIIENVQKYALNKEESATIDGYRMLNNRERESIRLIIQNYAANK